MKNLLLFLLALSLTLTAQTAPKSDVKPAPPADQKPAEPPPPPRPAPAATPTELLDRQLTGLERGLIPLAEAFPESAYDFKPPESAGSFKDVRTVREQLLHIAAGLDIFGASLLGEQSVVKNNDEMVKGPAHIKTKAEVIKFLKDSFARAHKGVQTLTTENMMERLDAKPFGNKFPRLSSVSICLWHSYDHYGQLVVYARMNNIVPPASQR